MLQNRFIVILLALCSLIMLRRVCLAQDTGPTVAGVRVIGCQRWSEAEILNMLKVRPGQLFQEALVQEDVRILNNTHRYISVAASKELKPDGIFVIYQVVERPVITKVTYQGAKHLSFEELAEITGLKPGSPMSVALNRLAADNIKRRYQEQGRYFSEVKLLKGNDHRDHEVVFHITEGPIVRIRDIRFEFYRKGKRFVGKSRLYTQLQSSKMFLNVIGGVFNPNSIQQDLISLRKYYESHGFFDVEIGHQIHWNPGYSTLDLVFVVNENARYSVKRVNYIGNKQIGTEVLQSHNQIKQGGYYNERDVQQSVRKMNDEYGKRGFITAVVEHEPRFYKEEGVVTVDYRVRQERPIQAKVGQVHIYGNTVTRDNVIRRQLTFIPGQILDLTAIRESQRNLERLTIFNNPQTGARPRIEILDRYGDEEFKDVIVHVEEQRTGSFLVGVGISSDSGASASVVIHERNFDICNPPTSFDEIWSGRAFRGAGQEFRVEVVPGTEVSRYTASWREPYIFDTKYSFGVSGYYYSRFFQEYDERRSGGRLTLGRQLGPYWSASLSFRAEQVRVTDFPFFAPDDFLEVAGDNELYAPRVTLTRDTRNNILRPSEGNLFRVWYEHGLGDFTFPVVSLEDTHYYTLHQRPDGSGRHILMMRGQVAVAGDDTPLFERFYAGGFRTLRGFDFRGVGPVKNGLNVGGTFMMLGSVEYQIPLMANDNLYFVMFSDFGTVEEDVEINDFRVSAGFGFRINVPMFGPVPLAFDFGFPINKTDTDDRRVFGFWLAGSY